MALAILWSGKISQSAPPPLQEIHVQLFGQDCILTGPHSAKILAAVHAIGPAQIPGSPDLLQAKQALEKITKIGELPMALDMYKEKFIHRLKLQIEFLEAQKSGNLETILKVSKANMNSKKFEALKSQLEPAPIPKGSKKAPAPNPMTPYELYCDGIEPNPEKYFFSALEKPLEIRYNCSLGETYEDVEDTDH
jgi:hypothetical protein